MPPRLYRFHRPGREDVLSDLTGRWLTGARGIRRRADPVARGLMAGIAADRTASTCAARRVPPRRFTQLRED